MVDGMMSSAFAAAHHVDSLSRMTSMANSISPPHPHTSPGERLNLTKVKSFSILYKKREEIPSFRENFIS